MDALRRATLLLVLFAVAPAAAQEPEALAFEWTRGAGAESCADRRTLEALVEARLERDAFTERAEGTVLRGRIERVEDGFRAALTLEVRGVRIGSREITSERADCAAMNDTLAVVVALLARVDAEEVRLALVREAEPEPPASAAASTPAERAEPTEPERLGWWGGFRVEAGWLRGVLPDRGFSVGLAVVVGGRRGFSAEGRLAASTRASAPLEGGGQVAATLRSGGVRLCWDTPWSPRVFGGGCLGADIGRLGAQTADLSRTGSARVPWVAPLASLRAGVRVRRFRAQLAVDALFRANDDAFVIDDGGASRVVHQPARVGWRLALGLGLSFGEGHR